MKWPAPVILGLSLLSVSSTASVLEAWTPDSTPDIMNSYYLKKFDALPLSGKIVQGNKLWSGNYWALSKGNINYRWYAKNKIGFNLRSPTKDQAKKMTIPELAELSPSEKFDLFTGRYDYPLKNEVSVIADPKAEIWEGICHGWSPATINHDEPTPKLMTNPDGIEVPFGSTDIKALLSYYYAYGFRSPDTHQMGKRCFKGRFNNNDKDCGEDLNAGAFHIILANRIGIDQRSFIADIQRYEQVWNHPFVGFESKIISTDRAYPNSAPQTVRTVHLQSRITYLDENGNDWQTVKGTPKQKYDQILYDYRLDLDRAGQIIGGNWISKERPDFLWLTLKARKFEGTLKRLDELLDE